MSDIQRAGYQFGGDFCRKCGGELDAADDVRVNEEGDMDCDGQYRDLTTVEHHPVCPPEEE